MNPPSAPKAAARLVCLASLCVRGLLEEEIDNTEAAEALEARARIRELLDCLNSVRTLGRPSLQESQAMVKPIGGWSVRERVNASWRVESAGVIAWSLGLLGEIPAYDTRFCSLDIAEVIPRTRESTRDFVRMAAFRPEGEIRKAREAAEGWLWRARTTQMQADQDKHTSPTPPEKYTEYVRSAARKGAANGWFVAVNEDFRLIRFLRR